VGVKTLKKVTVRFSTKKQCPWWVNDTGECRLEGGPLHCGNDPRDKPPNDCPVEDDPENTQELSPVSIDEKCPACKGTGFAEVYRGPDYGYKCEKCGGRGKI
jgi:hypothetical protein